MRHARLLVATMFLMMILVAGCDTTHRVEADTTHKVDTVHRVEVAPIHVTVDVNVRIDRALEDAFGFEEQFR